MKWFGLEEEWADEDAIAMECAAFDATLQKSGFEESAFDATGFRAAAQDFISFRSGKDAQFGLRPRVGHKKRPGIFRYRAFVEIRR